MRLNCNYSVQAVYPSVRFGAQFQLVSKRSDIKGAKENEIFPSQLLNNLEISLQERAKQPCTKLDSFSCFAMPFPNGFTYSFLFTKLDAKRFQAIKTKVNTEMGFDKIVQEYLRFKKQNKKQKDNKEVSYGSGRDIYDLKKLRPAFKRSEHQIIIDDEIYKIYYQERARKIYNEYFGIKHPKLPTLTIIHNENLQLQEFNTVLNILNQNKKIWFNLHAFTTHLLTDYQLKKAANDNYIKGKKSKFKKGKLSD